MPSAAARVQPGPRVGRHAQPDRRLFGIGRHAYRDCGNCAFYPAAEMRLILTLSVFLHRRDYQFGAIAALMLAILAAGLLIGAA